MTKYSRFHEIFKSDLHSSQRQCLSWGERVRTISADQAHEFGYSTRLLVVLEFAEQHEFRGLASGQLEERQLTFHTPWVSSKDDGSLKARLLSMDQTKKEGYRLFSLLVDEYAIIWHRVIRMLDIYLVRVDVGARAVQLTPQASR